MACNRWERNHKGSNARRDQDYPLDGGNNLVDVIHHLAGDYRKTKPAIAMLVGKKARDIYPSFMGIEGLMKANKWRLDLDRTFEIYSYTEE